VNPPKLLLDENLSPGIAVRLCQEGFDVAHVRDRGLLQASDAVVLACAFDEDRMLVTSNVDDFVKLGRAVQIHPGLVLFEDGGLLREEQLRLVREAMVLVQGELAAGRDMVNRALLIWADSTHVFESLP
jgi:predicted nuclease of predicted toxin-antitoxin system